MRIAIVRIDGIETICDQQDKDCNGINCKTCQFNKIGVDVKFLQEKIYRSALETLREDNNKRIDEITKAENISYKITQLLLQEEVDEKIIGEKIFVKKIK